MLTTTSRHYIIRFFIALLFIPYIAHANDYAQAGQTSDAVILVDRDQLKAMKTAYPMVVIKWIKHWRLPKDYGLKDKVMSESFDSYADCGRRDAIITTAHRLNAPDFSLIKSIEFTKFTDRDNPLKGARRDEAPPGSPQAMALDYACSWSEANR
jgi:hypothetical protein